MFKVRFGWCAWCGNDVRAIVHVIAIHEANNTFYYCSNIGSSSCNVFCSRECKWNAIYNDPRYECGEIGMTNKKYEFLCNSIGEENVKWLPCTECKHICPPKIIPEVGRYNTDMMKLSIDVIDEDYAWFIIVRHCSMFISAKHVITKDLVDSCKKLLSSNRRKDIRKTMGGCLI